MAVAGWDCLVEITGTSTAFTAEACSVVTGKTYDIDDVAKSVWDPDVAVVVWDNGAPVAANDIASIDFLFGRVTFDAGYTVAGAVTINSGNYLPRHVLVEAHTFRLTAGRAMLNDNRFGTDYMLRKSGLKDVTVEFGIKNSPRADIDTGGPVLELDDLIAAGSNFVVSLIIEDSSATEGIHRMLGLLESHSADTATEDQVMSTYSIVGNAKTQNANTVAYSEMTVGS